VGLEAVFSFASILQNVPKLYANRNHRFQVRVHLPSPYSPKIRTQQMLEIVYRIPQREIHDGQGEMILQIEGV
jgi:hypothetical protein